MAKIPVILEAGRADGKLATSSTIFDENKGMFQSEINDIQDTLNSDNPNKPLSAKQGKVLKELLDAKVIESGAVPIDPKPIEGNTTHIVSSDGLAKEFNKCNTAKITTDRIEDSAVTSEKIATSAFDSTLSVSGKIAPADVVGENITELKEKVDALALGKFYGYFPDSASLPTDVTTSGYAYVGLDNPYKIWNFNGESWFDSGTSIDMNDADEEDITRNAEGKLQFKDRSYGYGMGYVILRKNKTFAEQVTKENTIYEIRYNYNLDGKSAEIPVNCTLKFEGGAISNGTLLFGKGVTLSGDSSFLSNNVYTTPNGIELHLYNNCSVRLTKSEQGFLKIVSNNNAIIDVGGSTYLIPEFIDCIIRKTSVGAFYNTSGKRAIARFIHCKVFSPDFEERSETLCTTTFTTEGTQQTIYDMIADDIYSVEINNCEIEGQGFWGSLKIFNTKFVISTNNLYNYEPLHLVGNSIVRGCVFTNKENYSYDSSMQDIIDCYTSKMAIIENCIFRNITCAFVITFKQNLLQASQYYVENMGITIRNCSFENCIGGFRLQNDYKVSDFTNNEDNHISIVGNKFKNCYSSGSRTTISPNYSLIEIDNGASSVLIGDNYISWERRQVFVGLSDYCKDIKLNNNTIVASGLSGTCFLVNLYMSNDTSPHLRNISITNNVIEPCVVFQKPSLLSNTRGVEVTGNLAGVIFNDVDKDALNTRYDITITGNFYNYSGVIHKDDLKIVDAPNFTARRLQYYGSHYYDASMKKEIYWNGVAWVDAIGANVG